MKIIIILQFIFNRNTDGMRLIIHRQSDSIKIFTEDSWRDRAKIFPQLLEEIKKNIKVDFVVDTEFVEWQDNKPIPRESMMWVIQTKTPMSDDIELHVNVHDVLYFDEEAINLKPYYERLAFLDKLLPKDLKYLKKAKSCLATDRKSFDKCLKEAYSYPGSEGSMIKKADSIYDISKPRTADWCVGPNTPVYTVEGLKLIKDLRANQDFVLSKDAKFHKVKAISRRELEIDETLYALRRNDGWMYITGNHEILINPYKEEWISVEDSEESIVVPVITFNEAVKLSEVERNGHLFNYDRQPLLISEVSNDMVNFVYDIEIAGEDSFVTPFAICHNSKIKKVKIISVEIIGLQRKALPFSSINMKTPTENIEGEEALSTYKKLTEKSSTFIARCALRDNNKLVPLDSKKRLTESDFNVKWNASLSKPKWQGLDNKDLWKMNTAKDIKDRTPGDQAFGNTYAFSFKDNEPKLGDIISVVPVQLVEFSDNDKTHISWMFPKVISPEPEKQKADDIKDIQPMIRKE